MAKRQVSAKKGQDPIEIDIRELWISVAALMGSSVNGAPSTDEELKSMEDSVSFYVKNIIIGLKAVYILYSDNIMYRGRKNAVSYLINVLPLIGMGQLPSDEKEAKDFCRRFAFSPVQNSGTEFQSLFSRVSKDCKWPERYKGFPIEFLLNDWDERYPQISPYERSGYIVEDFLSDY